MKILLAIIAAIALTGCDPRAVDREDVIKRLKACKAQGHTIHECQVEICIVYPRRENCTTQ